MPFRSVRPAVPLLAAALSIAVAVSGCGSDGGGSEGAKAGAGQVDVVATFYPLQFVTERVGGDRVKVSALTRPGAEPHDLELTPGNVRTIAGSDLVVYLSGFQPAVDEAVTQEAKDVALDVASAARLDLRYRPLEHEGEEHAEDEEHAEGEEHAESEEHAAEEAVDPHFWLDPTRLADVGDAVAERLGRADSEGAEGYRDRAAAMRTELMALDGELGAALKTCTQRAFVTSHNAFGYFADRYDLTQVGIAGLSPETEPTGKALADAAAFVRKNKITTVYYETLVSPDVSRTVAQETGAQTAVLDPIEGLTDASAGRDYVAVMRANLTALTKGLSCR